MPQVHEPPGQTCSAVLFHVAKILQKYVLWQGAIQLKVPKLDRVAPSVTYPLYAKSTILHCNYFGTNHEISKSLLI